MCRIENKSNRIQPFALNWDSWQIKDCRVVNYIEEKKKVKIKKKIKKENRVGDHIWYITNMKKFKIHYPKWKQKYNTRKIIDELIENFKN